MQTSSKIGFCILMLVASTYGLSINSEGANSFVKRDGKEGMWSRRAMKSISWGKRWANKNKNWNSELTKLWGKRSSPEDDLDTYRVLKKRNADQELENEFEHEAQKKWQSQLTGSWGKRNGETFDHPETEVYEPERDQFRNSRTKRSQPTNSEDKLTPTEEKRKWGNSISWGKRWQSGLTGSWGKRWQSGLTGSWGKRDGPMSAEEVAVRLLVKFDRNGDQGLDLEELKELAISLINDLPELPNRTGVDKVGLPSSNQ